MLKNEAVTDVWRDFEKGRAYNRQKNLYTQTEQNYDYYYGNQAKYLNIGKETPVIENIIKSIVKYKLGVINSNAYEIVYNPNNTGAEDVELLEELCKVLSYNSNRIWELEQVGKKIRECVKDACINDEGIIHSYFDKKEQKVRSEVIDKNNIYYGNENDSDIQSQPYIIISYRKPVSQVREKARYLGISEDKIELINSDEESLEQAGYTSTNDEVNPMCLVLLKYFKVDGKVFYTRAVKSVILEEAESTDLEMYPVAHMVWEEVKGSARGVGAVRYVIPNQIEINKIATRRALAVKMAAFAKLVVNKEFVDNPSALEKVGSTIKIKGGATVEDVRKQVGYLNPANMSPDAKDLQDDLVSNTKDLEGAGDVATGAVDPTQASGRAILAVQQANQQPLNEQVNTYKYFIEDLARIYYDMWKAYLINGLNVVYEVKDEEGGEHEKAGVFTHELLNQLEANIRVDITPRSPYDRFAQEQSIESLMTNGQITFEEYVDALPEDSVMPKYILDKILNKRREKQQLIDSMQLQAQQVQGRLQKALMERRGVDGTIDAMQGQADNIQNNILSQIRRRENELSSVPTT